MKNKSDLQPTVIYNIISCSNTFTFKKEYIEILFEGSNKDDIIILKEELISIDKSIINKSNSNNNIYLYKATLDLKKNDIQQFKIKLFYIEGKEVISKFSHFVHKYEQLFVYSEIYEKYSWFGGNINDLNNKYKLSYLQMFLIYKNYLEKNGIEFLMPYLLEKTLNIFIKEEEIEFQFILDYLNTYIKYEENALNNFKKNDENIEIQSNQTKEIIELIVSGIEKKKKISVDNFCNKNYDEVMNFIENYGKNKDEILQSKIYLLLLLFYQFNEPEKFNEIFKRIKLKKNVLEFIKCHPENFSKLRSKNLKLLFKNINHNFTINDIIILSFNFKEFVDFLCSEEVYNNIMSNKCTIDFRKCPCPNESTDDESLIKYINVTLNLPLDDNEKDIYYLTKQFSILISNLNMKNYFKLKTLKTIFKDYNNYPLVKKIMENLNEAFHITGKFFIENSKLNSLEIIHFIKEDAKAYWNCYKRDKEYAYLMKYVDLNEVDDRFCNAFSEEDYNFEKLYEKNYELFLKAFIQNAKHFEHFKVLYKVFNVENNKHLDSRVTIRIIKTFSRRKFEKSNLTNQELSQIIGQLFKLVIFNCNDQDLLINCLIQGIKNNFSEQDTNEIIILILNIFNNQLNDNIIKKLIQNIKNLTNEQLISYLKKYINCDAIKVYFLKKLNLKVVNEDELLNIEISENLNLLFELIKMGYFSDSNINEMKYIKNTIEIVENVFQKLINLEFGIAQLKVLHLLNNIESDNTNNKSVGSNNNDNSNSIIDQFKDDFKINNLRKRCFILSLGDKFKYDEIYQKLHENINGYIETFEKLEGVINIFNVFFSNDKTDLINEYKEIKDKFLCNQVKDFPNQNNINNFDESVKIYYELIQLKASNIFIEIYKYLKDSYENNNDEFIIDKAKDEFSKFINLINENSEEYIELSFLEEIIIKINFDKIDDEINIIYKMNKLTKNPSNSNICRKLKLLNKRKNKILQLKKIILYLNDFYFDNNNIQKENDSNNESVNNNEDNKDDKECNENNQNQNYNININDNSTLNKTIENTITLLNDFNSLEQLLNIKNSLDNLNLPILNPKVNQKAQAVIDKMYEIPELMEFIIKNNINDIKQMCEFIDDSEEFHINTSDIEKLMNCMTFVEELRLKCKNLNEKETFDVFINLINNKYKDIGIKFENSSKKYFEFNELYKYQLNPNGLNKEHIKNIYKSSIFKLTSLYPSYICTVSYEIKISEYVKDLNNSKEIIKNTIRKVVKDFEEMLDLRDVALLRKKDQNEEDYFNVCESFANIISDIQEVLNILNIIASKGYFKDLNYIIEIDNGNAYGYQINSNNKERKNLKNIISELNNTIEIQNDNVKLTYLVNPITRLIYGRQFNYIYKILTCDNSDLKSLMENSNDFSKNNKVLNILKFVTNNIYQNDINENEYGKHELSLTHMFEDVSNFLNKLNINLENVYEKAFLLDKTKSGIYTHSCLKEDIEKNTIYCSLNLTGNFPLAQTVLYCNDDTSDEEIVSFLYRSIKCEQNVLFILIKPENLKTEQKYSLLVTLKELYSQNIQHIQSCLLFVYSNTNKNDDIIFQIENISNHKKLEYDLDEKNNNFSKKISKVEIYSSEFSGLGKSTLIKNDFREKYNEYEYIYFPLGGNINKNEIIERLLNLSNRRIALHLDLCDSNYIELVREFLFSFLILKFYAQNENIFYYGDEIEIKVEIPNSFIDFKRLFPIFDFFKNKYITSKELPKLNVPKTLDANAEIVCNYLNNLDKINDSDIYIKGINNSTSKCINAIELDQNLCATLIFKYLDIEKPNYYQIESFINIVAKQLIHLSKSYYLNVEQLNYVQNIKKKKNNYNNANYNNIRKFFVESLIKVTKHFITSSYNDIIKGQIIANDQQNKRIDYEEAIEKAKIILENRKEFSINNVGSNIILINEDDQSISIIVTNRDNADEYNLLKAVYNSGSLDKEIELLDYSNLTPNDFLIEVKKVLDLKSPINTIENIVNSYIFTEDNFIKLILISLRLRVKIPVILMGETGCGKTSLIRIIAELKGITMHILNIHAGIEDDDIIKFIKKKRLFENDLLNINEEDNNNKNNNNDENSNNENDDNNDIKSEEKKLNSSTKESNNKNENENENENENGNNENKDKMTDDNDIWVFLDEINTCNSLGLISELMLKHSCKGEKIKSNVKFIAACNPYRLETLKKDIIGLYNESRHVVRNLVYNVNPLPYSLLNFVFDFGTPSIEDIKRYISSMVTQILNKLIGDEEILNYIQTLAENSILKAHEFIKKKFGISSVSLREIRRWEILFKWFIKLLNISYVKNKFKFLEDKNICLYALNLSLYLCYFIRIYNKNERNEFVLLMKKRELFGREFDFESFPKKIQNLIADEVNLEKGIVRNKALLENLFAIFVCLNTNIPLFIVGKPGCSKSLSAQLIFKSMNGEDSTSDFFKNFPKVYTKSYQGSLTSNSKGILKIFKRARDSLKNENLSNRIISAIYFDEMGLAEISKNNPLKVIHSQLEYDDNEKKVSFIGISNWSLDASKMNRGIHLSIPEPDEDDLKKTALDIAESYDIKLTNDYSMYIEYLASTYYNYKKELKKLLLNNKKEFHGNRDFYNLIKIFSKLIINSNFTKNNLEIENILNESIERNFGGLEKSIKKFKKILKNSIPILNSTSNYNIMKCIIDNINDSNSRYLLIITKSSISHFLITSLLNQLEKNYVFYYGSNFEDDISQGYYSAKILNKIQVTISQDNVMILKNLTSMYPSLYDLFNQNFRMVGGSKYARIALGNSNTQNYLVNDNFRCVILLDKNEIEEQDPPFINRFEKHIITFEYLLNKNDILMSNQINNLFANIFEDEKYQKVKVDLKQELLNCDLEEIQGMIYQLSKDIKNMDKNQEMKNEKEIENDEIANSDENISINNINENNSINDSNNNINDYNERIDDNDINYNNEKEILKIILNKIIPTFSFDLIFFMKNSEFSKKYNKYFDIIMDIYIKDELKHKNLKAYLENINTNKHIIYTFSNIFDSIFDYNNKNNFIENEIYGNFTNEKTKNIFIHNYNSERAIEDVIIDYYCNSEKNHNLCLIHFDNDDLIYLNHINYLIENIERDINDTNIFSTKVILFVIHLKRRMTNNYNSEEDDYKIIKKEYLISHIAKWNQIFIDNLHGININIKDVYNSSNVELFNNKNLINLDEEFDNNLFHAFTLISYNLSINFSSIKFENFIEKICTFIKNNNELKNSIQNLIMKKIENIKESIILKIFTDYNFEDNDIDFISIIIKYMKSIYDNALVNTIIQLEKENIISTKMYNEEENIKNEYFDKIYQDYIDKLDLNIEKYSIFAHTQKINLILGVSCPLVISNLNNIKYYIVNLAKSYIENENKYRHEQTKEIKKSYFDTKSMFENNLKVEFEKLYFSQIFKNNNENFDDSLENNNNHKLIKLLFKDYILYYLSRSNIENLNSNLLKFFKALFKLFIQRDVKEYNKNKFSFENIIKFFIFIESYKDYIFPLCEFLCSLEEYIEDFTLLYKDQILLNLFKIENRNLNYVNDIFFNLFESVIYCIINTEQYFNENDEKFNIILNKIENFTHILMKINIELCLTIKQLLYLFDFFIVKEVILSNNISPLQDNLKKYLQYLKFQNLKYLLPNYYEINKYIDFTNEKYKIGDNEEPINDEFNFLKRILQDNKVYSNIIIRLLNDKIKISKNEDYRVKLLNILCSDNYAIHNSKIIFETLLKKFELIPTVLEENNNNNEEEKNKNGKTKDEESEDDESEDNENEDDKSEDNEENYNNDSDNDEDDEYDDDDDDNDDNDIDDNDNDISVKFLQNIKREKNNKIIKFINSTENDFLNEVLLSLFDGKFLKYFQNIDDEYLNKSSFNLFNTCIKYIEKEDCVINSNNKLGILYCISYIKCYCYKFNNLLINNTGEEGNRNIINIVNNYLNITYPFRKTIKLYILKLLYLNHFNSYLEFCNYVQDENLFINDFNLYENDSRSFDYLFIQNNSIKKYMNLKKIYTNIKNQYFKNWEDFLDCLKGDGNEISISDLLNFYDVLVNEDLSKLDSKFNQKYYLKFSTCITDILEQLHLQPLTKTVFSIYLNINFVSQLFTLNRNISTSNYETLLYAHKLTLLCSLSKNNSFYKKIISPDVIHNLENIYIPGGEPNYNSLIESGDQIKDYINSGEGLKFGIYMCSCETWYALEDCGLPGVLSTCKKCNQQIGGTNHRLVSRNGHYKICVNDMQAQQCRQNNIPFKMFNDFLNEVNEKRNIPIKGFKNVERSFFVNKKKKVRNMSNITYRLLSFIFYSCIFYNEKLGYLTPDDLRIFYYSDISNDNQSIISILSEIWRILEEELSQREINNIQCFINMIIPELMKILMENDKEMESPEEREIFEKKCDEMIEQCILNYTDYYNNFIQNNKNINEHKNDTIKAILQEISDLTTLPKDSYPLINYFYLTNYPNMTEFEEQLNNSSDTMNEYPIIKSYINAKNLGFIDILQNFHFINPLVTYSLHKYNNKVTREDAEKVIIIKNELEKDDKMKKLFEKFREGWKRNDFYLSLSNYDCHGTLPPKDINDNDYLAYILNDNLKDDFGKYIATAYKDFITYQNEFLKALLEINRTDSKDYLSPYINQINSEIIIQRARKKEVVSLDIKNDLFSSFEDLIFAFSNRNCYNDEDKKINYLNYRKNKYDFYSVEIELTKILLPDKKLFLPEKNQDFITFAYEGFNQNECIIIDFNEKIKNIQLLSKGQRKNLRDVAEGMNYNYKSFLFNMQSLFLYFTNVKNVTGDEKLKDEIHQIDKSSSKIIKFDNEFKDIFNNLQFDLKVNQLIDCYDYIEFLNFNDIKKNVSEFAKLHLSNEQFEQINMYFEKEKRLVNKSELRSALRKFISRYLISERFIKYENNITDILEYKPELWSEETNLEKNEMVFHDDIKELKQINIKIEQSVDFYDSLKEKKEDTNNLIKNKNHRKKIKTKTKIVDNVDY